MEYINICLILLTILLLCITSYENFSGCANNKQSIMIDSLTSGCCPPDSLGNKYTIENGLCCRNKITTSEFNKLENKMKKKYVKNRIPGKDIYCDNKPSTIG